MSRPILLAFILALGLRLFFLSIFPHVITFHEADGIGYIAIAKSLVTTGGLGNTSVHFPPFFPLIISIVSLFLKDFEFSARIASCIMGSLIIFPLYTIGKEIYDHTTALIVVITTMFLLDFLDYSLQPISQMTYLFLIAYTMVFCLFLINKSSYPLSFFVGLLSGTITLTRPEGIVILFMIVVVVLSLVRTQPLQRIMALIIVMCIGFLIVMLPYSMYLHDKTGIWGISGKAKLAIKGVDNTGDTSDVGLRQVLDKQIVTHYIERAITFSKTVLNKFSIPYILFAVAGLLFTLTSFHFQHFVVLLIPFAIILPVFLFPLPYAISYILPIYITIVLIASKGVGGSINVIVRYIGTSENSFRSALTMFLPIIIALLFSVSSSLAYYQAMNGPHARKFFSEQEFLHKTTGQWLQLHTPQDAVVMTRWSNIGYYGERKHIFLPDDSIDDIIRNAQSHGAQYIVFDSSALARRKELLPLLLPGGHPASLKILYVAQKHTTSVIIYEVLNEG